MGRFSRLMHPMPLPGRLPLAPCQFLLSPSLWLTAYLSTVKVVPWNTLYHFVLPLSRRFFLPVLSFVLPVRRESVAGRVRTVRCSEFFHHAIRTCSTDNIFRFSWAVCLAGVPSVSSLTVHIVSRCTPKSKPKFAFLLGEILFA